MTAPVDRVALTVVRFLGAVALIGVIGVVFLVYVTIGYETIDPSTVALVAGVSTLAGSALGALGAVLATTGKGTQPVTVENGADQPVPVDPEAGHTSVEIVLLTVIAVIVVLLFFGVRL